MLSRSSLVTLLALGVAGCGQLLGIEHLKGPPEGDAGPPGETGAGLADCQAQRVVHLVGGNGGLAWFTLTWPLPDVIVGFQATYAYDNPANAKDVTTSQGHGLFARKIGTRAIWEGLGSDPYPSVFVAGTNETHTTTPTSTLTSGGIGMVAAGAAMQTSLAPTYPALLIGGGLAFGVAPGAPIPVSVTNVDGAIGLFSPTIQDQVRPSAAQVAAYLPTNATTTETTFATELAFTANALRLGLFGTVMMKAFNDDPHGAFNNGVATPRANNLANMLDAFYRDLGMSFETRCGRGGNMLSVADNTVMIVTGDTPKNSFLADGWQDGTSGNANLIYLRSNGFTRPGWFGRITDTTRTNFDPSSGLLDAQATNTASTAAAFAGALYAIARGDKAKVTPFTVAPFNGLILH